MADLVCNTDAYWAPNGWRDWPVPQMPVLPAEPWQGVPAFWKEPVDTRPVDLFRTADLAKFDVPIVASGGAPVWEGASSGFPYNIVAEKGGKTPVWDMSRAPVWSFTWAAGLVRRDPIVQVPLPDRVVREGDPAGAFDRHVHLFDPTEQVLYELIQADRSPLNLLKTWGSCDWVAGYNGAAPIARWDCKKPWDAPGQPRGAVAAAIPQFPLIPRWDDVKKGRVGHALFLGLPNYAPGFVAPARGSDGTMPGHPLRAGARLRLKAGVAESFPNGTAARVIANALREYGCVMGDRNRWDVNPDGTPRWDGTGAWPLSQDRRWWNGADGYTGIRDVPFRTRLTDFEVIA